MTQKATSESTKYHVPALEKSLDILEYLSELSVPQSQADIARALNRKTSEIFRMLDCLEQRGYLLRDSDAKYQLSLKLYKLAHTHSPIEKLLEAARSPMRQLAQQLRESVHLSILHEQQLLVVAEELNPNPIRLSVEVGKSFPAVQTASGRLLLSQLNKSELDSFLANDPHIKHSSLKAQKALKKELKALQGQSFLVAESDITVGVQDIAMLIGQATLGVSATLTIPLLMLKGKLLETDSILDNLRAAAQNINTRLGFDA